MPTAVGFESSMRGLSAVLGMGTAISGSVAFLAYHICLTLATMMPTSSIPLIALTYAPTSSSLANMKRSSVRESALDALKAVMTLSLRSNWSCKAFNVNAASAFSTIAGIPTILAWV